MDIASSRSQNGGLFSNYQSPAISSYVNKLVSFSSLYTLCKISTLRLDEYTLSITFYRLLQPKLKKLPDIFRALLSHNSKY
jgi:hypothetical protein